MKRILVILICFSSIGCARTIEPTAENVNKIFASQDFTFEFHKTGETTKSISFRDDYLVYKSDQPTVRREISYDEVLLINDFIQNIVNLHQQDADPAPSFYYVVKNTAYTTTIIPDQEAYYFEALLKTLKLYEQ
ncbi:hypothetical protein [uncultured Aquimarina sp.]|uniref:hypothetical protein n=1 Tax=uncultured Aquimarina sp. TaxID=575652 RepID=UPI00261A3EBA|nr:hypothetical protein [uncultured Aquimarina sp.]